MSITISSTLLQDIQSHGESAYPEEGAGLLLGTASGQDKVVTEILTLENARESSARHNRYLLTAEDYLRGENEAARRGLDVLGVFHSHPDHPNQPSPGCKCWLIISNALQPLHTCSCIKTPLITEHIIPTAILILDLDQPIG